MTEKHVHTFIRSYLNTVNHDTVLRHLDTRVNTFLMNVISLNEGGVNRDAVKSIFATLYLRMSFFKVPCD